MTRYLNAQGIRIFDYPSFSQPLTEQIRQNAQRIAGENGIEIEFIRKQRAFRKDDRIQKIISETGKTAGLVHIFSAMEQCSTYKPWHDKTAGKTSLKFDKSKCLHYYFYFIDKEPGLCYLRVPAWPPFHLQFYMNGHSLPVHKLQKKNISYRMHDNAFLMPALDTFHSVRYAWGHIISRFTKKSLNSFYYTLEHAAFEHQQWASVTARPALRTVPSSMKDSAIFLSIDDTMAEKYGVKFKACSRLFDHAAHNDSSYLNGHCFVSVMMHVPVMSADRIIYLSLPLGYRLWTKEESKLELAAQMVRSVMPELVSCRQVILLCDSWYPKKPVTGLADEFENLEIICNVRIDTVLYDLPGKRTGKRGRPRMQTAPTLQYGFCRLQRSFLRSVKVI